MMSGNCILHSCWTDSNAEVHLAAFDDSCSYTGTVEGARTWLWLNKGTLFATTVVMDDEVILLPDIRM